MLQGRMTKIRKPANKMNKRKPAKKVNKTSNKLYWSNLNKTKTASILVDRKPTSPERSNKEWKLMNARQM